ncbi:hypothetical protein [Kineococcus rhizosphaerae]|uniref:Uncharacterized protein n=1 Tax=Kineococcus rhizosphaerae TaxID=559628 RepID=A0A2T0QTL3_9ACTN|nr:hypothetical protein [Kineococcus rhizosphaerae]PRY08422.1 hypothetical protein CLV37_12417 [Kineococcus rhizosphaerae]
MGVLVKILLAPLVALDRWHAFMYRFLNSRGADGERAHARLHMAQGGLLVLLGSIFLLSYYPIICVPFVALSVPYFVAAAKRRRKAQTFIAQDEVRARRQSRDGLKHPSHGITRG